VYQKLPLFRVCKTLKINFAILLAFFCCMCNEDTFFCVCRQGLLRPAIDIADTVRRHLLLAQAANKDLVCSFIYLHFCSFDVICFMHWDDNNNDSYMTLWSASFGAPPTGPASHKQAAWDRPGIDAIKDELQSAVTDPLRNKPCDIRTR